MDYQKIRLGTKKLSLRDKESLMRLIERASMNDLIEISGQLGWSDVEPVLIAFADNDYGCGENIALHISYGDE